MKIKTDLRGGYPGGSYTQSCDFIDFDPGTHVLKAACKQRNGALNWTESFIPDVYDDIVNCDGNLELNDCW